MTRQTLLLDTLDNFFEARTVGVRTTSALAATAKRRTVQAADDAYSEAVIRLLRDRLRQVSNTTGESLEVVLGPADELAARVAAAVPSSSKLAAVVGPVYRQAGLAKAYGLTRQAVNEWVRNRRVLSLITADDVVLNGDSVIHRLATGDMSEVMAVVEVARRRWIR